MFPRSGKIQECPVCGRPVQVRDEYAGLAVNCWHCGGQFVARTPRSGARHPVHGLLRRAERLLALAEPS